MNNIYNFLAAAILIVSLPCTMTYGQTFTIERDTTTSTPIGSTAIVNGITAVSGTVTIRWNVVSTDFPTDWVSPTGVCDNNLCYALSSLLGGSYKMSNPYSTTLGDFHVLIDLSSATTLGCYYLKIDLRDAAAIGVRTQTYIVCKNAPTATPAVIASNENIIFYPNPVADQLNIICAPSENITKALVYDVLGKLIATYEISGISNKIDVVNLTQGMYVFRLIDSDGNLKATKKFTKL